MKFTDIYIYIHMHRPRSNELYIYIAQIGTEMKPDINAASTLTPDTRHQNKAAAFDQRPRPLHNRYSTTEWTLAHVSEWPL
jgi:hypothetical protein